MPRSKGRQRKGPRYLLRPWEPRLAVATLVAAALMGPLGAAAVLAVPVAPSGQNPAASPETAAALAVIGLAVLAWLALARRHRQRTSAPADEASIALPTALPAMLDLDLDLLVTAARASGGRMRDGRGSQADDRMPDEPGSAEPRPSAAPVWVRRLDERIPIMPTHQNTPVDHGPASRPRRSVRRGSRERGGA